jgi:hypothetical protein
MSGEPVRPNPRRRRRHRRAHPGSASSILAGAGIPRPTSSAGAPPARRHMISVQEMPVFVIHYTLLVDRREHLGEVQVWIAVMRALRPMPGTRFRAGSNAIGEQGPRAWRTDGQAGCG